MGQCFRDKAGLYIQLCVPAGLYCEQILSRLSPVSFSRVRIEQSRWRFALSYCIIIALSYLIVRSNMIVALFEGFLLTIVSLTSRM